MERAVVVPIAGVRNVFRIKRPVLKGLTVKGKGELVRVHGHVASPWGDWTRIDSGAAKQVVGIVAADSVYNLGDLEKGESDWAAGVK